jgi:hypothetical protein
MGAQDALRLQGRSLQLFALHSLNNVDCARSVNLGTSTNRGCS